MVIAAIFYILGFLQGIILFQLFFKEFTLSDKGPEILTSIGTLLAVIVAIYGDWIKTKLFPPNVQLVSTWENTQGTQGHTRLLFRNIGKSTAYEVEVYVTKISDMGQVRQGFLPVPLIWTHTAGPETKRDFHPKQFGYYLDLCRIDDVTNPSIEPKIPLIFGAGVSTYQNIYHGQTTLDLVIFQKSEDVIYYSVRLEWIRGQDKFVRILDYKKQHTT